MPALLCYRWPNPARPDVEYDGKLTTMTAIAASGTRGRVLSGQQVRFSDAPVRLGSQNRCSHAEPSATLRTCPDTGDVLAIVVQCGCGDVTVVECHYDRGRHGAV